MSDIQQLTEKLRKFSVARGWREVNTPKNLAVSLAIEVGEVLEHVQWKSPEEVQEMLEEDNTAFGYEIADVAIYLFQLADVSGIDLAKAIEEKIVKNNEKYPLSGKQTN